MEMFQMTKVITTLCMI